MARRRFRGRGLPARWRRRALAGSGPRGPRAVAVARRDRRPPRDRTDAGSVGAGEGRAGDRAPRPGGHGPRAAGRRGQLPVDRHRRLHPPLGGVAGPHGRGPRGPRRADRPHRGGARRHHAAPPGRGRQHLLGLRAGLRRRRRGGDRAAPPGRGQLAARVRADDAGRHPHRRGDRARRRLLRADRQPRRPHPGHRPTRVGGGVGGDDGAGAGPAAEPVLADRPGSSPPEGDRRARADLPARRRRGTGGGPGAGPGRRVVGRRPSPRARALGAAHRPPRPAGAAGRGAAGGGVEDGAGRAGRRRRRDRQDPPDARSWPTRPRPPA